MAALEPPRREYSDKVSFHNGVLFAWRNRALQIGPGGVASYETYDINIQMYAVPPVQTAADIFLEIPKTPEFFRFSLSVASP